MCGFHYFWVSISLTEQTLLYSTKHPSYVSYAAKIFSSQVCLLVHLPSSMHGLFRSQGPVIFINDRFSLFWVSNSFIEQTHLYSTKHPSYVSYARLFSTQVCLLITIIIIIIMIIMIIIIMMIIIFLFHKGNTVKYKI